MAATVRVQRMQGEKTGVSRARGRAPSARSAGGVAGSSVVARDVAAFILGSQRPGARSAPAASGSEIGDVMRSPGAPLHQPLRGEMEARLGADFADVRVHTGETAHRAAVSFDAHAFTSGSHIVFQRGQYDTGSAAGKIMLAHELTHVLQQRSGPVSSNDVGGGLAVSDPSDAFERAAAANAERVMAGTVPARHFLRDAAPARHVHGVVAQRMHSGDTAAASANPTWPSEEWKKELDELQKGNNLLGPNNRLFKDAPPEVKELAGELVASLQDPAKPANEAKETLTKMRAKWPSRQKTKAGADPRAANASGFPTTISNDLLEIINAKVLWQAGDTQLAPWPFNASEKKPDYLVTDANNKIPSSGGRTPEDFYKDQAKVGDHVRVAGQRTLEDLATQFGKQVQGKLSTYKDKKVRVVVDLTENDLKGEEEEVSKIWRFDSKLSADSKEVKKVGSKLSAKLLSVVPEKSRASLLQVDAILPKYRFQLRPPKWESEGFQRD